MIAGYALDNARQQTERLVDRYRAEGAGQTNPPRALVQGAFQQATAWGMPGMDDVEYQRFRGWVYSAIRPIAQTIAGQPIHVAKLNRTPGNRGIHRDLVPNRLKAMASNLELYERHPLLDVFANPNVAMTSWHLLFITIASLELTGKSHWWLTISNGKPEIWPIPTSWISPIHGDSEPYADWNVMPGGIGVPEKVPGKEIIYIYYPDPSDPFGAVSPAWAQSKGIGADEQLQESQVRAFANSIWPGLALIMGDPDQIDFDQDGGPPLLEVEQRQQMLAAVKQHYAGVTKAGEPLILDALIKDVKQITRGINEMDFLDSGKVTKGRITQGFGTNPIIMGELEGANRASSQFAKEHFADFTVNPKIELISQVLTRAFQSRSPQPKQELQVWIEPYQPKNREEVRKDYDLLAKYQATNRDELRAALRGLPPMENGETIPAAMNQQLIPAAIQKTKANGRPTKMISDQKSLAIRVKARLAERETMEAVMQRAFAELFIEQRDDVVSRLLDIYKNHPNTINKAGNPRGWVELIFRPADWYERTAEIVGPTVTQTMLTGAVIEYNDASKAEKAGPSIEDLMIELPPDVAQAVRGEASMIINSPYWRDVHETTKAQLAQTLQEGMENGENLHQLSARIGDAPTVPVQDPGVFPPGTRFGSNAVLGSESSARRALLIARTEVPGAMNAGHQQAMMELEAEGIIEKKQWMAITDQYTRQTHFALHGVKIPVKDNFNVGGEMAPYPGHHGLSAKERVNCRCVPVSVHAEITGAAHEPTIKGESLELTCV